ncbi:MAG: YfhO family protein [candidate division Zixibacteria bacterium]|nr:YfhO family protein [candidate division Zixibacteria bacterium]
MRTPVSFSPWMYDLVAVIGFLALAIVFFWPVITGQAYFWEDFVKQMYPYRVYNAVELSSGRFPFWNPYLFGGIPYFAMIDTAVLYPPDWLFTLFVQGDTLSFLVVELQSIGHVVLFGAGTYALGLHFGISRPAAFLSGITALFSGRLIHQMFNTSMLNPYAWLPWGVLFFFRAVERKSLPDALIGGGLMGIALIAGHTQIVMYMFYTLAILFALWLFFQLKDSENRLQTILHAGLPYAIINVVGIGLAAVVLLPAYELTEHTDRAAMSYQEVVTYSLHPKQLITFLMPDFFGRTDPFLWQYWGPGYKEYGRFWETYGYTGILPLFLAAIALYVRRERIALCFGVLAGLAVLAALGNNNPLYAIVYEIVPGFDRFRIPARTLFVFDFAIAVLAGFGADILWKSEVYASCKPFIKRFLITTTGGIGTAILVYWVLKNAILAYLTEDPSFWSLAEEAMRTETPSFMVFAGGSILLLVAWYRKTLPRLALVCAAGLLIFVDLYFAGAGFNQGANPPEKYFNHPRISFIQAQQREEGGRVAIRNNPYLLVERNAGLLHRIYTMDGYTSPLKLNETTPPRDAWPLMNVTYHLGMDSTTQQVDILKSFFPTSPAFVVRDYVVAKGREAVDGAMGDSSFHYRQKVVLDEIPHMRLSGDTALASETPVLERYEANEMVVSVTLKTPGILVLAEVYYPAWKAYMEESELKIYRANDTMRAVVLPAGRHTVTFRYESTAFRTGVAVSVLTLLLAAGGFFALYRQRRVSDTTLP